MSTLLTPEYSPVEPGGPSRRRSFGTAAGIAAVVLLTLALASAWRWISDDAFINFRAVRNILEGAGPVFNAGERVEVGTSPLWLWLLAALAWVLPYDVAWISVVLGALASAGGVLLACLGATRINRTFGEPGVGRPPLLLPVGAL